MSDPALRRRAEDAEKSVAVLLEVLPALIVEAATDFHNSYMDGRQPALDENALRARLDRILEPMQTSHLAPRVQAENERLREALKFVRTLARHDPAIRKVVDEALGTEDEGDRQRAP